MQNIVYRSRAPLRISFGGGGTDISPYPELYQGAVFSTTIDLFSYSSITLRKEKILEVESQDFNIKQIIKNHQNLKSNEKLFLVKTILKNLNPKTKGMKITLFSDARIGSGLGASSSSTVALLGNLLQIFKIPKTRHEIAELAYKIERIDCKIMGGYQDQYSTTFGGFNLIEFRKDNVVVNPLKLREEVKEELLGNLILCDTREIRQEKVYEKIISSQSKRAEKNNQDTEVLHKIKKSAYEMKDSLVKGDLDHFGHLLDQVWEEKKKISPNMSTKKIDKIYQKSKEVGVIGGKLLGAGGGGYMLLYCNMEKKNKLVKMLNKLNVNVTKFNFEYSGLLTWSVFNGRIS